MRFNYQANRTPLDVICDGMENIRITHTIHNQLVYNCSLAIHLLFLVNIGKPISSRYEQAIIKRFGE